MLPRPVWPPLMPRWLKTIGKAGPRNPPTHERGR